jgi:hypothetical protein
VFTTSNENTHYVTPFSFVSCNTWFSGPTENEPFDLSYFGIFYGTFFKQICSTNQVRYFSLKINLSYKLAEDLLNTATLAVI